MRPLVEFPRDARRAVRYVLTDIDDTLTDGGRLGAKAYGALEAVSAAGMTVVVVTGRPAGWCDMIARQWPVSAVVGENGACYMRYDAARGRMERRFWRDGAAPAADRARLKALGRRILREVPGTALASDQPYREADLAIDYCEDVPPLGPEAVERILGLFRAAGATAKASSIHVNGWFGDYDKLAMTKRLFAEVFGVELDRARDNTVFVGDSPNDEPMFTYFPNAVGVANVRRFLPGLRNPPRWVTRAEGGAGFAELADALLEART
jgi:HAD superfamily hydrolase (TIGR01484 family)